MSDGTDAGTTRLSENIRVNQLVAQQDKLYFVSDDGVHGEELWVTDGTLDQTFRLTDVQSGSASGAIQELIAADKQVFFTADDSVTGRELWRSDATALGTHRVTDLSPADLNPPSSLETIGNVAFFTAYTELDPFSNFPESQLGLWLSDGTDVLRVDADGSFTPRYRTIESSDSAVYFRGLDPQQQESLWAYRNTTPTANFGGAVTVVEGSGPLKLEASGSSDGEQTLTDFAWDFDYDGLQFDEDATGITADYVATSDGPSTGTVALRVRDLFGATDITSATVTVENAAPLIQGVEDLSAEFGQTINLTSNVTDPGSLDVLTYEWDSGDGTVVSGVNLDSLQHDYTAEGEYFASLTVTDSDGAATHQGFRVVIAPPTQFVSTSQTLSEDQATIELVAEYAAGATEDIIIPLQFEGRARLGSDFTVSSESILIPGGQTIGKVTLMILEDVLSEDTEVIRVAMGVPTNASLGANSVVEITLTDDDPLPSVFFLSSGQTVEEEVGNVPVWASLSEPAGRDVIVPLNFWGTATQDVDYEAVAELVIPEGRLTD